MCLQLLTNSLTSWEFTSSMFLFHGAHARSRSVTHAHKHSPVRAQRRQQFGIVVPVTVTDTVTATVAVTLSSQRTRAEVLHRRSKTQSLKTMCKVSPGAKQPRTRCIPEAVKCDALAKNATVKCLTLDASLLYQLQEVKSIGQKVNRSKILWLQLIFIIIYHLLDFVFLCAVLTLNASA